MDFSDVLSKDQILAAYEDAKNKLVEHFEENFGESFRQLQQTNAALERTNADLKRERDTLQDQLLKSREEARTVPNLKDAISCMALKVENLKEGGVQDLENQVERLTRERNEIQQNLDLHIAFCREQELKHEANDIWAKELQQKMVDVQAEADRSSAEVNAKKALIIRMRNEYDEQGRQLYEAKQTNQLQMAESQRLTMENSEIAGKLEKAILDLRTSQQLVSNLEEEKLKKADSEAEINATQALLVRTTNESDEHKRQLYEAKQANQLQVSEIQRLTTENSELSGKLDKAISDFKTSQQLVSDLEEERLKQNENVENFFQSHQQLRAQIQALTKENKELKSEKLSISKKKLEESRNLMEKIEKLEKELKETAHNAQLSREKIDQLEKGKNARGVVLQALTEAKLKLEKDLEICNAKISDFELKEKDFENFKNYKLMELNDKKKELLEANNLIEQLKNEQKDKYEKNLQLEQSIANMQKELDDTRIANYHLQVQNDELSGLPTVLESAMKKAEEAHLKIQKLQADVERLEIESGHRKDVVMRLQKELEALKSEVEFQRKRYEEMETNKTAETQLVNEYEEKLGALYQKCSDLEAELGKNLEEEEIKLKKSLKRVQEKREEYELARKVKKVDKLFF